MVWLLVRIHTMNQNATALRARPFLRLCPPGQPATKMNGNHTSPFNPVADRAVRAVSHKV
jgi:hypothetical protein